MILDKILAIFLIMGVGFAARKAKAIDGEFVRALSAFMINLALPFALLGSFDRSIPRSTLPELGVMLLWSAGAHAFAIGLASLLYRKFPDNQRKVLTFTTVFTNSAFMGLPIAQSVAGAKGFMFAAVYNVVYGFLFYSYGVQLFRKTAGSGWWKKALVNPGNVALAVGLALWLLPFAPPGFFRDAVALMSKLQTPLAMFVVGANIAMIDLRRLSTGKALLAAVAVRLAVMPLLVYAATRLLGAAGLAPAIVTLMVAMPAGAQTVIVAESQGGDSGFAAEVVFATTILSVISIPLFAGLVA